MITKFQIHELFPNAKTIDKPRNIIVYHGSEKWFQKFDLKKIGLNTGNDYLSLLGFHFTKDYDIAKFFSEKNDRGQILTVNLHVNKTLKLTEHELVLGIYKYAENKNMTFFNYDYDYVKNIPYYKSTEEYDDTLYNIITKDYDLQTSKKIVNLFKKNILLKNGYDSIEYLNQIEFRKNERRYDFIILKENSIEVDLQRIQRF